MCTCTQTCIACLSVIQCRSPMTSKCGKNKKVAHKPPPVSAGSVSLMFLPHFDVYCDLLLNRSTAVEPTTCIYCICFV